MIKPWRTLSSRPLGDFRVFSVRQDRKVSPRTGREHDYFIIDCPDWVNVVALTPSRQMVLVEQFRHGSNSVELEIPGGVIDPADANPVAAACRELAEETGYEGEKPILLGHVFPNPAIMSNRCYAVLVQNCRLARPLHMDDDEDLDTILFPIEQVGELVASGRIRHSLVVATLHLFDLWSKKSAPPR